MINEKMYELGSKRSIIREIFEYGNMRRSIVGVDNVYDFSLGNPNVPSPKELDASISKLCIKEGIHAYTSAPGAISVREAIAKNLNERFKTSFHKDNLYLTVGAAAALTATLRGLCNPGDEVITFAPYFTEYKVFTESALAKLVVVSPDFKNFQIKFDEFEKLINKNTKAVIINSPNNPSGVVYKEETIIKLAKILKEKSIEFGNPIYLISDEPYREIVYNNVQVPFVTKYYNNAIVCYSYSKSLSLPGERLGYVLVPDQVDDSKIVYAAICGAGRALGYVCAPSLFQFVIEECVNITSDMSYYEVNRNIILNGLRELGFECIEPDGAFYLFVKSPIADANEFAKKAQEYDILIVPGDDFGCPGYVRIAYCVSKKIIENSLPAFKKLAEFYNL